MYLPFQVDFDEWVVCGRFVVKPHVDSILDDSKMPHVVSSVYRNKQFNPFAADPIKALHFAILV